MAQERCPKCLEIIDSNDQECKNCGYQLNAAAKIDKVTVPKKDSFSVDENNFSSIKSDKVFIEKDSKLETKDASNSNPYTKPAIYSQSKVKELQLGYLVTYLFSLLAVGLGIAFLIIAIDQIKNEGKTDFALVVALLCFAFGIPMFIYCLIRFIQVCRNPGLACALDAKRKKDAVKDITDDAINTLLK